MELKIPRFVVEQVYPNLAFNSSAISSAMKIGDSTVRYDVATVGSNRLHACDVDWGGVGGADESLMHETAGSLHHPRGKLGFAFPQQTCDSERDVGSRLPPRDRGRGAFQSTAIRVFPGATGPSGPPTTATGLVRQDRPCSRGLASLWRTCTCAHQTRRHYQLGGFAHDLGTPDANSHACAGCRELRSWGPHAFASQGQCGGDQNAGGR